MGKVIVFVLLLSTPAYAQDGEKAARAVSWVALGAGVALDTVDAFKQDDKKRALAAEGVGLVATGLSTLAMKKAFPEDRPCAKQMDCGNEDPHASWWSGHSANACFMVPTTSKAMWVTGSVLAGFVIIGRIAGNRHYWWDTAAGCADGIVMHQVMRKVFKTR
ncbi:MAG: phosphatase PAP2 family protein [Gemmatimonadota bacterium]